MANNFFKFYSIFFPFIFVNTHLTSKQTVFSIVLLTKSLGRRGFEKKTLAKGAIRSEKMTAEEMADDRQGRFRKINTS